MCLVVDDVASMNSVFVLRNLMWLRILISDKSEQNDIDVKNVFNVHFVKLQNCENQNAVDFIVAVHEQWDVIEIRIDVENQLLERFKMWTIIDLCVVVNN